MSKNYITLRERVEYAYQERQALNICAAGSKQFYGRNPAGTPLDVRDNRGIIDYDPSELVIVARAGTPLAELEAALAESQQMLGFEPPFSPQCATIGGAVASGLAGAGRPYYGAARDYLLGTKLLNGKAEIAQFGGRVMKNVAGFDLFRPMAGAMGTLGLLLEVSLRVIPVPEKQQDLAFEVASETDAITLFNRFGSSLPSLSAAGWYQGQARVRLSGSALAVERDRAILARSHTLSKADSTFRLSVSNFSHDFFEPPAQSSIMAFDLAPATPPLALDGDWLIDWGGGRRYLSSTQSPAALRQAATEAQGSATLIRGGKRSDCFQPLDAALFKVHQRLKQAFDPRGILNPGRLYPGL